MRKRSSRTKNPGAAPGILDDGLFNNEFHDQDMASRPEFDPAAFARPTASTQQRTLSTSTAQISHSPSLMSSVSNMKSDTSYPASDPSTFPTPFPYSQPQTQPPFHPPMPLSYPHYGTPPQSYQGTSETSNEKGGGPSGSSVAGNSAAYAGEGSSTVQYFPLVVQNSQSPPLSPAGASLPLAGSSSAAPAPYQHQDAGRVPEEVPPAYKDTWRAGS